MENETQTTQYSKSDAEYLAAYKLEKGTGFFRDPFDGIFVPLFIIWNMLAPLVLIASIATFFGPGWFLALFYFLVWCELEPGFSEEWRAAKGQSLDDYRISVMKAREDKAVSAKKAEAAAKKAEAAASAEYHKNWHFQYQVIKSRGGSNDEAAWYAKEYANQGGGGPATLLPAYQGPNASGNIVPFSTPRIILPINMEQKPPYKGHAGYEG